MKMSFGPKELSKCLIRLGLEPESRKATSHVKFKYNTNKKLPDGSRPFITLIEGRNIYDPITRGRYITQLKRLGFSLKEIKKGLGY